LRIKGELLLEEAATQASSAAEDCFVGAINLAREQGALFWELRSALSLSRLKANSGRPDEARKVLAPVYNRFTEGLETADLRAAKAMLDALTPGSAKPMA
jgi:predicted ATPase